jgi:hypothetical protein
MQFPVPWGSIDKLAEPCDSRHRPGWAQRLRHWSALLFVRAEAMAQIELRAESVLMAQRSPESYLYALALENGVIEVSRQGDWRWGPQVDNTGSSTLSDNYSHLAVLFAPLLHAESEVDALRWLRNRSVCGHGWGGANSAAVLKALKLVQDLLRAVDSSGVWRRTVSDFQLRQPLGVAAVLGASLNVRLASP